MRRQLCLCRAKIFIYYYFVHSNSNVNFNFWAKKMLPLVVGEQHASLTSEATNSSLNASELDVFIKVFGYSVHGFGICTSSALSY